MPTRKQAAGVRRPSLKLTAAICATGLALATFDQSSVTAALAAIRDDLDVEITALQWVTTLLPLTAAVALPLSGTLGDLWGPARPCRSVCWCSLSARCWCWSPTT